ncbi:hypothetical protein [Acinetobacter larvae]|uniref:DUF4199 domain-containing protein n=1 Tax=Acinetobacter larvae TaxID=1789224 RepID=A0A1B2M216_9GAMM|nr:hypothetical protein [Acinetobacter larvae]AOA59240.1 hypothetical protein BFG52_13305 [Acinetobacter larvae]
MNNKAISPEKSPWGWKALGIAAVLSVLFLGIFYLAMSNEPDYMPSQQQKHTQQHAFKTAPAMSPEALETAKQQQQAAEAAKAPQHSSTHSEH